jgi:hypothetical protein
MGNLLSHVERMLTICFGNASSFVKQSQNRLTCLVDLIDPISTRAPRGGRKRNN